MLVPLLHPATSNSAACSETPTEACYLLILSRWLVVGISEGVADCKGLLVGSCAEAGGLENPPTVPAELETRVGTSSMLLLAVLYTYLS